MNATGPSLRHVPVAWLMFPAGAALAVFGWLKVALAVGFAVAPLAGLGMELYEGWRIGRAARRHWLRPARAPRLSAGTEA